MRLGMKVLVLGGTGAMGQYLVQILSMQGHDVYVTSRAQHKEKFDNIHYIQGNAHELNFIQELLESSFDVMIDFMSYTTAEFLERYKFFIKSVGQYIFLSSARVYAESKKPLTEKSPRLLETVNDPVYLRTDEYALAKARQEDLLRELDNSQNNWTIVRPYITYSRNRFQLGMYEKETWLYRALQGGTVVFPRDMASCVTTLTFGGDVARGIACLVGNEKALGETVHIASQESLTWGEIIEIYRNILATEVGIALKIHWLDQEEKLPKSINKYQILYDRMCCRQFDTEKIVKLSSGRLSFTSAKEGLRVCLCDFLREPCYKRIPCRTQAWMDRIMHERMPLQTFRSTPDKLMYLSLRYVPLLSNW